jgi:hypothetical protein
MLKKMQMLILARVEIGKIMILIKTKELINKQMLKIMEIVIKLLLIKMPNKIQMLILVRVVKDKMKKRKMKLIKIKKLINKQMFRIKVIEMK